MRPRSAVAAWSSRLLDKWATVAVRNGIRSNRSEVREGLALRHIRHRRDVVSPPPAAHPNQGPQPFIQSRVEKFTHPAARRESDVKRTEEPDQRAQRQGGQHQTIDDALWHTCP